MEEVLKDNLSSINNKRIAKNTLLLYIRMGIVTIVAIFSSRIVLQALGVVDYGIYGVVGGVVAFLGIFQSSISAATSRYLNYDLGAKDFDALNKDFSASLNIYAIIACVVLLLGETLGLWFVNTYLNIPSERMFAANVVYQCILVMCVMSLLTAAYSASIFAHEHFGFYAWYSIIEVFVKLGAAYLVLLMGFDHLIIYLLLLTAIHVSINLVVFIYSHHNFLECRIRFFYEKKTYVKLAAYSGWNLFGTSAGLVMGQGVNILLNIFFGPTVNAARNIAYQVSGAISQFFVSFYGAARPQVIKYFAEDNLYEMHKLISRTARFAFYLGLIIAIPIFIELPYVIQLWLGQKPEFVVVFTKLTIIICLIDCLSNPLKTACLASDNIRGYQIGVSLINLMTLPLAYLAILIFNTPESVFVVTLIIAILALLGRAYYAQKLVDLKISYYFKNVIFRILPITIISPIVPLIVSQQMGESFIRLLMTTLASILCTTIIVWFFGMNISERRSIIGHIKKQ